MKAVPASQFSPVRNTRAFGLLEVMLAIFIVALGASIVMPRLLRVSPSETWESYVETITLYCRAARQAAFLSGKVHRLLFREKEQKVTIEVSMGMDERGKERYVPVEETASCPSSYQWPSVFRVREVNLHKKRLFEEQRGKAAVYVSPNGIIDGVVFVVERSGETLERRQYALMPFLATLRDLSQEIRVQ